MELAIPLLLFICIAHYIVPMLVVFSIYSAQKGFAILIVLDERYVSI